MTPDQARDLLDGTTPGPWEWRWDTGTLSVFDVEEEPVAIDLDVRDSDLIAAAPALAAMIAGMRPQYRAEYRLADGTWAMVDAEKCDGWTTVHGFARGHAAKLARTGAAVRIVRRYVTEPEVTDATD